METSPTPITASVLAHSVLEGDPVDLWTVQATFPRSVLAELNTHRAMSRNSASSRAIPVSKMIKMAVETPYIPRRFSLNQKGMHASEFVDFGDDRWQECLEWWLTARDSAVDQAERGLALGLHKQEVNRVLEPFLMHTAIISATDWDNFFALRKAQDGNGNPLAAPPMYDLAVAIYDAMTMDEDWTYSRIPLPWERPEPMKWHLPLIFPSDQNLSLIDKIKVSVARCARVSYLTHDGQRDVEADLDLFTRLRSNGHWSPLEHAAHPHEVGSGNFRKWRQLRWYVEQGLIFA